MTRNRAIFILAVLALVTGAVIGYALLPKRYSVSERLTQTNVFWNDKEAFFFLSTTTVGQSSNFLSDKLEKTKYGYLAFFLRGRNQFYEYSVMAYRLLPTGELQRLQVPDESTTAGNWTLQDGKLQVAPTATEFNQHTGFRWDGEKLVSVPPQRKPETQADGKSKLNPDDLDDEGDREARFLSPSARKSFKDAGWHYKVMLPYESREPQASLGIRLGKSSFDLTITSFPPPSQETLFVRLSRVRDKDSTAFQEQSTTNKSDALESKRQANDFQG